MADTPDNTNGTRPPAAVVRDTTGRWVRGGPSPNPGGRPKGVAQKAREAADNANIWKVLEDIAGGSGGGSTRDRLEAIRILLERGHGKATEVSVQLQADLAEGAPGIADLANEHLEELARSLAASPALPTGPLATTLATVEGQLVRNPAEPEDDST